MFSSKSTFFTKKSWSNIFILDFSQLRICRPPPSPQKLSNFHEIFTESNEKSIFLFSLIELWLIVFTIYGDTPGFSSVSPIRIVQEWPNSQEIYAMN